MKLTVNHMGAMVVLNKDHNSSGDNKVLKHAGSIGQIVGIQSFDNLATLKIGKRNYKVSQNDIELIQKAEY